MSINRIILVVPVIAGLMLAGTAFARMLPAETVRDSAYPACVHNGVHFNKQGHANCGLHKGWQSEEPETTGQQPTDEAGDAGAQQREQQGARQGGQTTHDKHAGRLTHAKHEEHAKHEKVHGGGRSQHTTGGSSHGGGHGSSSTHGKHGGKPH